MPPSGEHGVAAASEASGNRGADVITGPDDRDCGITPGCLCGDRWIAALDRARHDETSFFDIHRRRGEGRGQAIGPNHAPPATLNALIKPKTTSAAASAAKTPWISPVQRKASQPPPTATTSREQLATNGHNSRPAPCE